MPDVPSYLTLHLSAFAHAETAADLPVKLDGSQPFSIDGWVRLSGLCASASIFRKAGVFDFGVAGEALTLSINGYPTVYSDTADPLTENEWRYVCATFAGGQARLYIDGNFNAFQAISGQGQTSADAFEIGHTLQGQIRSVRVYNTALSADQVMAAMYGTPDAGAIAAWFDFTATPPSDLGPAHLPISLSSKARMMVETPAVAIAATAYAQPIWDEDVNPGGLQTDPYTVQAWAYVEDPDAPVQALFVNGDLETDSGMALYLERAENEPGFIVKSQRGSIDELDTTLASTTTVLPNRWANIATTFDGTTLSIYIDGELAGQGAFGPVPSMRLESDLLIGAALSHGSPLAATSLQGHLARIDVWSRALSAEEISQSMAAAPDPATPDLTALYEFASAPARNAVTSHPVGLADGAELSNQITHVSPDETLVVEPDRDQAEPSRAEIEMLAELRAGLDFSHILKGDPELFSRACAKDCDTIAAHVAPEERDEARQKMEAAWREAEEALRERPHDLPFLVTRHRVGGEDLLVHHGPTDSRIVFRAAAGAYDDCTLWKVQLVFVVIGGVLDLLFGVRAQLTDRALAYIAKVVLRNPRIAAILALGSAITASDLFSLGRTLYDFGMLKALAKLVIEVGFWTLLRVVAKLVLKFLLPWGAAVDFIASLAATAAVFITTYLSRPSSCTPLPNVTLAGVWFNHSPSNSSTCAINIRKNYTTQVDVPEWVQSETDPAQSPAAYALAAIAGNTVTVKARFVISTRDPVQMQIQALDGGVLGAIAPVTINFKNGVSDPEWVTLPLSAQTLAAAGVARQDVTWTWQYRPMGGGAWTGLQTTRHRIYTVLAAPSAPWQQSGFPASPQNPWTDVLDHACQWASGSTTPDAAAAAVTRTVNQSLNLTYDMSRGASAYTEGNTTISRWVFLATPFLNFLKGAPSPGRIINCTDCATIVSTFANAVGCDLTQSCMERGFALNQIIAIGYNAFGYPGFGPAFSYHEVAWTGGLSYADPLYDACLQVDGGSQPWNWNPGVTHTPTLPLKMPFTTMGMSPTTPIPMPFSAQSYRERLCANTAAGIGACNPVGPKPLTNSGRRPLQ